MLRSLLALVLLTLSAPAVALAAPPPAPNQAAATEEAPELLWAQVQVLAERVEDTRAKARLDLQRRLTSAAIHRFEAMIDDLRVEVALLGRLYEVDRDVEKRSEALTALGVAQEDISRAQELVHLLKRME